MARSYCPRCAYPEKTCLCHAIRETRYRTRIVVLQDPHESAHAKNTARLIGLVSPETEIVAGNTADDFSAVRDRFQMDPHAVVLYPRPDTPSLQESVNVEPIATIIIIDGTWRKAKKLWLSNPWLQSMRNCHLNDANDSAYNIRRSRVPGGLSSVEAAAHALGQLEETTTEPLWDAFMAMQAQWPASDN